LPQTSPCPLLRRSSDEKSDHFGPFSPCHEKLFEITLLP
jgi:hypothetical protein